MKKIKGYSRFAAAMGGLSALRNRHNSPGFSVGIADRSPVVGVKPDNPLTDALLNSLEVLLDFFQKIADYQGGALRRSLQRAESFLQNSFAKLFDEKSGIRKLIGGLIPKIVRWTVFGSIY